MIDLSKFKDLFISEAEDHVQSLNRNLLSYEKEIAKPRENLRETTRKLLDELMRSAHTIKSSSATMGFNKMAFLTHVMEDIFDYARNEILEITPEIIQELFKTVDLLEESLNSIKKDDKELDLSGQVDSLKKLTGVITEGIGRSVRSDEGKPVVKISDFRLQNAELETKKQKDIESENGEKNNLQSKESNIEKISHIKVPVERLDKLMDLMEELLIDKMRFEKYVKDIEVLYNQTQRGLISDLKFINLKSEILNLKSVAEHLSRLVSDIQYQVMQARLVPVEQIFARFPRMVRDLSQSQNKKVELQIIGGDMELDRTVIDKLAEPLVHLLRNAVDHGISDKGIIKLQAKREKEYALIMVENSGNSIDWKKVAEAAINKNIINKNEGDKLLSHIENFRLQNKDVEDIKINNSNLQSEIKNLKSLVDLIFHPRLSTKEKVTETSGRGVGLSVVKEFANQMGGRIEVESPLPDGGARFTLELPLSLAIINALLVEAKESIFAIPFSGIERSVSVSGDDIKSMADQDVAVVDGVDVPLVRLNKIFLNAELGAQKQKNTKTQKQDDTDNLENSKNTDSTDNLKSEILNLKSNETVVLVKKGKEMAGIVVDKLISQQEIIVKPLPSIIKNIHGFSGSTILGDGKTILIIDTVGLLKDAKRLVRS